MDIELLVEYGEEALRQEPTSALKFHWKKNLARLRDGVYSINDVQKIMYLLERSDDPLHQAFVENETVTV